MFFLVGCLNFFFREKKKKVLYNLLSGVFLKNFAQNRELVD